MKDNTTRFVAINAWTGLTRPGIGLQKITLPAGDLCISCHMRRKMTGQDICTECDHAADQWRDADDWMEELTD